MTGYYNADEERQIGLAAKLLAKASSTDSKPEADSLRAKAQEIMTTLGVDTATVERHANKGDTGKREEAKVEGGFYVWQRDLWKAVARMNFCFHFIEEYNHQLDKPKRYYEKRSWQSEGDGPIIVTHQRRKRHRLIGRTVNVAWTKMLCGYLQDAVEKALAAYVAVPENLGASKNIMYGTSANSFREGMAAELVDKISAKFKRKLAEAERERHKQAKAAGHDTGRALTVLDVKDAEYAGNYDHMYGPGAWAKVLKERAEEAEQERLEREAYTAWAKAHPEEAKAREEEARKHQRRYYSGGRSSWDGLSAKERKRDDNAYSAGAKAAAKVSLDPQVDRGSSVGRIGRSK